MKFALTQSFNCSYLPDQQEQLLILAEHPQHISDKHYELLISLGFRRSGEQIYRPRCPSCQACQALRIPVAMFKPSKSQQRILKQNSDLHVQVSRHNQAHYYPLYEQYINQRHADGSMYPASEAQYSGFIINPWQHALFLEIHQHDQLVGVAVTDVVGDSLSALYTFFLPELSQRSLGTYAILQQIEFARQQNFQYLYLGYQIDACQKMNYKQKFLPHERYLHDNWQLITKKSG